jgi:flavin-dependent dehydrogenase
VSPESLNLLASLLGGDSPLLGRTPLIQRSRIYLDGKLLELALTPAGASITRLELDEALWQASTAVCGLDARHSSPVHDITGTGPFTIQTSGEQLTASCVIVATGRWSRLEKFRPKLSAGPRWIGLKAHFEERDAPSSTDLYFFDHGYCGVQAIDDATVNACAMVRSDVACSLEEVFGKNSALLERSKHWRQLFSTVTTSPLIFREPTPVKNNIFMAGDAAGFIDPFAGDGISLALRSGALAARHVISHARGDRTLEEALREYKADYNREFLPVFRSAAWLRFGLTLPRSIRSRIAGILSIPMVARAVVHSTRGSIAS